MIDYASIHKQLIPPVNKSVLCNLISQGMSLPGNVKAIAFIAVNAMTQTQVNNLATMADQALSFIENKDYEGLSGFMLQNNVPPVFVEFIKNASNHPQK